MSNNELLNVLKQLASAIKKTIDESVSNGSVLPQDEVYFRWKVDKFRYTDKGVSDYGAHGEYFTRKSWLRAVIELEERIKNSSEYSYTLNCLTQAFGDKLSFYFEMFIRRLINQYLNSPEKPETYADSPIANFLKDLREEPVRCSAQVELQGIVLQPKNVKPVFGVILRQTNTEDLEKEYPVYGFPMTQVHLPHPSAIMNIEFFGRGASEVQKKVEKAIVILRLFKVGSVQSILYHMSSESIMDIVSGTLTSGRRGSALETYLITKEDDQRLRRFWQRMTDSLPRNFFEVDVMGTDYLGIAYKRYSDALLENGLLERRIANTVMGLEALFFKAGEAQELPYRLGIRLSKLLGDLGYDPHEVKKVINDAYKVRNLFAHGGQLSYKRKKKLESIYGNVRNLLLSVLDYLRISIVAMLLVKKGKDELIDLIDDSLIDSKQAERLNQIISQAKEIAR